MMESEQIDSTHFFRTFTLRQLGIDTKQFLNQIGPTYDNLRWDMYDVTRGGLQEPCRQRAIAEFEIVHTGNDWNIKRTPARPYVQGGEFYGFDRTIERTFDEVNERYTDNPLMMQFQTALANIVRQQNDGIDRIRMILTFLRTVHDEKAIGQCTLEKGPHTDSSHRVVPGLPLKRQNLKPTSGVSSTHAMNDELLWERVLQPGQGTIQDDVNLKHSISNIEREDDSKPGIRDILGVDMHAL